MTTTTAGRTHRVSAFLHRHPRVRLTGVLGAPMLWLGVAYLGSLAALLITAFWQVDSFTAEITRDWTIQNFVDIFSEEVYRTITFRSVAVAAAVTVIDAIIAFPIAFYMAKVASPRVARLLVVAVLMPLWASYLVKVYAWRVMTIEGGVLEGSIGVTPGFGLVTLVLTLSYLWLPYMILPIYAGLDRMPDSLLDASADLGARAGRTVWSVVFPTIVPAVFAGSVFTFSLSLGDYISVEIIGGASQLLGTVVYDNVGAANNLPFAAAMATLSVAVMLLYLAAVRRTGALENL